MGAMEKTRESIQKSPSIHERYPFRWVDKREEPSRLITCSRWYPDPTADAAIANVMREEKHKRKEELMAKLRKKQYEQEVVKELEKENRRECRKQMKQGKEAGDA